MIVYILQLIIYKLVDDFKYYYKVNIDYFKTCVIMLCV
jgi:hypothetical protein